MSREPRLGLAFFIPPVYFFGVPFLTLSLGSRTCGRRFCGVHPVVRALVASQVRGSVYWGQNYVRIRGLHRTSFYIPSRVLRQFNVPHTIALIPRDFFADSIEVDVRLALRLVVMWEERLTHSYGSAELGITQPMAVEVVRSIWVRVQDRVLGDSHQMAWSPFGDEEPTDDVVIRAY